MDYDRRWPGQFRELARRLSGIAPRARVEHIGSTAVPGCAAKPIIDVSVGLPPGCRFGADEARAIGLEFRSVHPYSALFALSDGDGRRIAHVHVRALGSESEIRDLRFRDYLRAHPRATRAYVAAKRRILSTRSLVGDYTRAKEPFIEGLSGAIRRWADETRWNPRGTKPAKPRLARPGRRTGGRERGAARSPARGPRRGTGSPSGPRRGRGGASSSVPGSRR